MKSNGPSAALILLLVLVAASFRLPYTLCAAPAKPDLTSHLVAWWTFDEIVADSIKDFSGHNHAGVLEHFSGTNATPGRIGGALSFDGKESSVRVTNFKGVTGTHPRTIAAWIKTKGQSGEIVSWGSDEPGKRFTFGFVRARIGLVPKGGYLFMNDPVHDGEWHHVAIVVSEASPPNLHDHVKLYKDGERAEIGDIGLLDLWPIDTGDTLELRIGRRFTGAIDELRIYDRALSEDEITALYKLQTAP